MRQGIQDRGCSRPAQERQAWPTVKSIQAVAVYEEEVLAGNFKMTRGTNPSVLHNVDPLMKIEDLGDIVGAYCIANIKGAPPHNTWMPIDDIMKCADRSEAFNPRDKS